MKTKGGEFIWFDGKFVPWEDAKVPVFTHALHYGTAVFTSPSVMSEENTVFAAYARSSELATKDPATKATANSPNHFGVVIMLTRNWKDL